MLNNQMEGTSCTLLDHQIRIVLPFILIFLGIYTILQLLTGYYGLCQNQAYDIQIPYTMIVISGACFGLYATMQILKILSFLHKNRIPSSQQQSIINILVCTFIICLISGSSQFLTALYNYGGVCRDVFGNLSAAAQWSEWFTSVPFLAYLSCSVESVTRLDQSDTGFIMLFAFMMFTGFMMVIDTTSSTLGGTMFFFSFSSLLLGTFLTFQPFEATSVNSKRNPNDPIALEQEVLDIFKVKQRKQKKFLKCGLLCILPYFPVVYILSWVHIIDGVTLLGLNAIGSFIGKLLFASLVLDAHLELQEDYNLLCTSEYRAKLAKSMAEKYSDELRIMIANVAHDLKSPLTAIMGGTDLIINATTDVVHSFEGVMPTNKSNATELLTTISSSAKNVQSTNSFMLMTINRCIEYTKASQGIKLSPKYESIQLLSSIREPVAVMMDLQQRFPIDLKYLVTEFSDNLHIITDRQWLVDNLLCYLSNAVKYSKEGGNIALEISLVDRDVAMKKADRVDSNSMDVIRLSNESLHSSNSKSSGKMEETQENNTVENLDVNSPHSVAPKFIIIKVVDHGIGVASSQIGTLFRLNPNQDNATRRLVGGMGLGLYSLANRLDALGGYYGAEPNCAIVDTTNSASEESSGVTFWFAIPLLIDVIRSNPPTKIVDQQINGVQVKEDSTQSTPRLDITLNEPLSILLVEDSIPILKMMANVLKKYGHNVDLAENGLIAFTKIQEKVDQRYDVILTDLQMPVMDGLEATKKIREFQETSKAIDDGSGNNVTNIQHHQIIIGCSANSDYETIDAAYAAGVDAFLSKPFNISKFQDLYQTLAEKYNQK